MTRKLERVQLLLDSEQRKALARVARMRGTSVSETARTAIAMGLAGMEQQEHLEQRGRALRLAERHRVAMNPLDVQVDRDIASMREERDDRSAGE